MNKFQIKALFDRKILYKVNTSVVQKYIYNFSISSYLVKYARILMHIK